MAHLRGLDGLRGLAVIAVLLYHSGALTGGFLGVEVFFVISGFLITQLLLQEWLQRDRIDLPAFWGRRALRLLPASFAVIGATLTLAVLFQPDEVVSLRGAALAGLLSFSNWYSVFAQQSYFESVRRPSLLLHLWSLGIEAQFYVVWPVLLLFGLRRWRRGYLICLALVGAAGSAGLMALRYQPLVDSSRLYYETDTRATGLLIGSALGLSWPHLRSLDRAPPLLVDAVGVVALGTLTYLMFRLSELEPLLYLGGFAAVGLATAVAITMAVHPGGHLGRTLLDRQPLHWIGTRSYGIYLWHWPIFQFTRPQLDVPLEGLPLMFVRLVIVAIIAEVSYRYIEAPVRGGALGRAWASLRERPRVGMRYVGVASVVLTGSVLLGTSVAAAKPPERPSYLPVDSVNTWRGDTRFADEPAPTPFRAAVETAPAPTPLSAAVETAPAPTLLSAAVETAPTPTQVPEPIPEPELAMAAALIRVTAIGDSVMLGAVQALQADIDGIEVDAAVSRQVSAAIEILRTRAATGDLGGVVIVHVGVNGTFTTGQFDELMGVLSGVRRVVLVNLSVPRTWEAPNNAVLADGVQRYPNTVLVDWHAASAGRPELFWDDGIHLRPDGAATYAALIAAAVQN